MSSMTTLSHSSNTSHPAEALLNRARRLSSNAYERSRSPIPFPEGESCHSSSSPSLQIHHQTSFHNILLTSSSRRASSASTNVPSPSTISQALISTPSTITTTPITSTIFSEKQQQQQQEPIVQSPTEGTCGGLSDAALCANTFLDVRRAHALPCATTGPRLAASLSARPRALSMESIRETRDTQSDETSAKQTPQRESHRKHLSENGGSLVYGILAALRQNTELESPEFPFPRQADRSAESSISPTMDSDKSLTTDPINNNNNNTSTKTSPSAAIPSSVLVSADSTDVSTVETESETLPESVNETRESCTIDNRTLSAKEPKENSLEQETKQDPPSIVPESRPLEEPHTSTTSTSPPSSTKSTGSLDHEKKEGKPSLLQKMGMRKNSFNESSSAKDKNTADSCAKSQTANSAARPNFPKASKRSSKLLGKFVHKILPISISNTNSTPTASPQVQTAAQSPLSARPSRSSSVASQITQENETIISAEATATITAITLPLSPPASSKGSQESLPLVSSPCDEVASPAPIPEASSVVFVEITEDDRGDKPSSAGYFDVEYEHETVEEDEDENKQKSTEADEALMSPYVIDDDCDDDFFLNSVLRKKLNLTLDVTPEKPPVMFSSYPSNTTLDSVHSAPSLSGWSSASSQASTPSPTSTSFPSSQMYPSPSTNTKAPSMHIQYRSNPLPTPVNSGLDEKRTRLRDAVSEWRRSTNASF